MSTLRTLEYDVTVYFQYDHVHRVQRARCVAEAIEKVKQRVSHAYLAAAIVAQLRN